jgi:hypothetical protein
MADDKKTKLDFEKVESQLYELHKGEHIDDIAERISDTFIKHITIKDENGKTTKKRKLDENNAEKLGHKLYDILGEYLHLDYFKGDEKSLPAFTKKGPHGDSALDSLVQAYFGLSRTALVKTLRKRAEHGESFSNRYIQNLMEESYKKHNGLRQSKILETIDLEHMDDIKERIKMYMERHKLPEKDLKPVLKSKDIEEVLGAYTQIAQVHYQKPPKEEKTYKKAA